MDQDRSLQIRTIKTVFSGLNNDEQSILIEDLMKIAKIDSVINVNHPTIFAGIEVPAPIETPEEKELRVHKKNFTKWMMPFFCKFLKIVDDDYLNQCFEIYLLLEKRSVGGRYIGTEEARHCHIYACSDNYEGDHREEHFMSSEDKKSMFRGNMIDEDIFTDVDPELLEVIRICSNRYIARITFTELTVVLANDPEKAKLILHILGYLAAEYEQIFLQTFSEIRSVEAIGDSEENIKYIREIIPQLIIE